jgi:hypothetical protein
MGFFGGDSKPVDISAQLSMAKALRERQGRAVEATYAKLPGITQDYTNQTEAGIEDIRNRVGTESTKYLGDIQQNTEQSKDALRRALYGNTFSGVPAAMQAVREAGAAGAGVGGGAYLRGVEGVGQTVAEKLATGEQELQAKGLQTQADARTQAYNTFSNLESKLGEANLDKISKVMDTGRTDTLQRLALEMGLNSEETQSLIDLMNFRSSSQLAADQSNSANKAAIISAMIGGIGGIAGQYAGKK